MKKTLLLGLLTGVLAFAQGKSAAYLPNDIKILGTLDNGQTSEPVAYSTTPRYRAFVFEANGRDVVEVTVTGGNRYAFVALADSSLRPIATGRGLLRATLPYRGPDTEAYYILFKDSTNQPARLAVHLNKSHAAVQPTGATH